MIKYSEISTAQDVKKKKRSFMNFFFFGGGQPPPLILQKKSWQKALMPCYACNVDFSSVLETVPL